MASPRLDRKTDYRHFPQAYSELLQRFADEGTARLGPMKYNAALGARRDLYRYRMFLINAVEDDPDDTFARELYDAARDVYMRVEGSGDECFIVLELNPIVAAMRRSGPDVAASGPLTEGQSRQARGEPCSTYCGRADCYVRSEDDIEPAKFRCAKSTAPARIIQ